MNSNKIIIIALLLFPMLSIAQSRSDNKITEIDLVNKVVDQRAVIRWAKFLRSNCSPYRVNEVSLKKRKIINIQEIINDIESFKLNVECEGNFHLLPRKNALRNVLNNISFVNTKLNKIEGLSNVIEANNILLEENKTLKSLEGLLNIGRVTEDYIIINAEFKNLDNLKNLTKVRKLHIENVPIEDLNGINRYLNCDEIYFNNIKIKTFRRTNMGLALRRGCKKITINNSLLEDLGGLELVKNLDFLDLKNNKLKKITGLANLEKVNFIDLSNNELTNVHGLRKIKELRYLDLSNNKITSVSGLRILEVVNEHLKLNDNLLESLRRMEKLRKVGTLDISNNMLKNVDELENLEEVEYSIILDRNNLRNLNGFKNLKKVKAIYLRSNIRLNDLSGLNNVKEGKLFIDSKEYRIKLSKDSYFCNNFKTKVFYGYEESDFKNKDSFCEN
jgi:Leucine-rich repeat (LRR) protein